MNKLGQTIAYLALSWIILIAIAAAWIAIANAFNNWKAAEFPYGNLCQSNFERYKNTCPN